MIPDLDIIKTNRILYSRHKPVFSSFETVHLFWLEALTAVILCLAATNIRFIAFSFKNTLETVLIMSSFFYIWIIKLASTGKCCV